MFLCQILASHRCIKFFWPCKESKAFANFKKCSKYVDCYIYLITELKFVNAKAL